MHIQRMLLKCTFVVDAVSDLGQPFRPRQKRCDLGLEKEHYRPVQLVARVKYGAIGSPRFL